VSSDETLGELSRRLTRFEERHQRERESADLRHLDAKVYFAEREAMREQIAKQGRAIETLETRYSWALRAAVTGILFPLIVLIVGGILYVRGPS
jgi:hypothetical protein